MTVAMDPDTGLLRPSDTFHAHITPFAGANIEASALEFNGINIECALRGAQDETQVMKDLCKWVSKAQKQQGCQRSIITAHNAAFDQGFINAAITRSHIKRTPFHPFVSFDTTSMAALTIGQTVLVKACQTAGIEFDQKQAHGALYDTQKTTELFCYMANRYQSLGGFPIS